MASATQRQQALYQQQHQQQQRQMSSSHRPTQLELTGMHMVPEITVTGSHPPYKISKIPVGNKIVTCINLKSYTNAEFLMTLSDFMDHFYPNTSIDTLKQALLALRISLFIGNR